MRSNATQLPTHLVQDGVRLSRRMTSVKQLRGCEGSNLSQFQVTCITKPDRDSRHEAITHLGGPGWYLSVPDVIAHMKAKRHEFYVLGPSGKRAIVWWRVSSSGREFVQTFSDNQWDNNLLSLRQCS